MYPEKSDQKSDFRTSHRAGLFYFNLFHYIQFGPSVFENMDGFSDLTDDFRINFSHGNSFFTPESAYIIPPRIQ